MTARSPHDFLLYLRGANPELARRLDHFTSLGFTDGALRLRLDTSRWPGSELVARRGELEELIKNFFADVCGTGLVIEEDAANPERLPFPITSSKYWNHVAFINGTGGHYTALAVPKPIYEELDPGDTTTSAIKELPEAVVISAAAAATMADALAVLVDPLTALAKQKGSYVHFLTPFPGDTGASLLEARLYSVKEWGTPDTPSAIVRKFLGRLHYCDPENPVLGLRLALAKELN